MPKHRLLLALVLLLLTGLLLIPSVRWPAYGRLRGEAFYQGMPTSWWAKEIEGSYYYFGYANSGGGGTSVWCVESPASLWDQVLSRLKPGTTAISVTRITLGSPLLVGDAQALPVLLALLRGESVKGRRVASCGLSALRGLLARSRPNPEVVQALLTAIEDSDDIVRRDAIAALQHIDPDAAAKAGVK